MERLLVAFEQALIAEDVHFLVSQLFGQVGFCLLNYHVHLLILGCRVLLTSHPAHWAVYVQVSLQALQMDEMPARQSCIMLYRIF